MSILKKIFLQPYLDKRLVGVWTSDMDDTETQKSIGVVKMTFTAQGELIYDIDDSNKIQRILLTYECKDGFLISDQPSNPRKEKTKYEIVNKTLILEYDGQTTRFIKQEYNAQVY